MSDISRPQRLDAILAHHGYCSRSEARAWVKARRVRVRGEVMRSSSEKALLQDVLVDGEPVDCPAGVLAVLHKPEGYICTHDSKEGATIYDLLPPRWTRRNPPVTSIGRLDKDATGILLLTDNGELVHRWTSPKHKVPKLYEVTVAGELTAGLVELFAAGTLQLEDDEKPCLPAKLEILSAHGARLELIEGRYHQVKRMFATQGLSVTRLHRARFGEFPLGDLPLGKWRLLPMPK